ncbi:hypothetical protein BGX30_002000 [Mortierella sp. GBA39]|nr:hypothetical protein BGX30_002000 [Mortierella sp. GBA39]
MEVSRITYGAMELGGGNAFSGGLTRWELRPEEDNIRLLRQAFDHGVNSFDTAELYGAGRSEFIVGKALAHPEYHMLQRSIEDELLDYCLQNDISIMSYNSLAKGILTGIFHKGKEVTDFRKERPLFQSENLRKTEGLIRLLGEIAAAKGATLSQIAISWLLGRKGLTSAIVGTQNEKHFFENLHSTDIELTEEEATKLGDLSKQTLQNLD